MILDTGLDAACVSPGIGGGVGGTAYPQFAAFVTYAAIGTGSTTPSASDTALVAQVGSRVNYNGGFAASTSRGLDGANNVAWHESTFTRVFNITSNVNAAEWGLARAASGDLSVRELFRADPLDNNSNPIALTLEDGDQLQLVVTLRVEATWEYETKSFVITGTAGNDAAGTHEGHATFTTGAAGSGSVTGGLTSLWPAGISNSTDGSGYVAAFTSAQSGVGKGDNLSGAFVYTAAVGQAYTPGDHFRDSIAVYSTAAANGDIYAFTATPSSSPNDVSLGLRFILTDPPYLTKASTHRLTLTLRKHISRL